MLVRDIAASLLRRWYLTVAGLLVTVGLVFVALALVHPTWEAKATIVLLPPKSSVAVGGNPYLELDGLSPTLDLLSTSMSDQELQEAMQKASPTVDFTVKPDSTTSGPVLAITAHDVTPAASLAARDELVRLVPRRLSALQDRLQIPPRARIGQMPVTQDITPTLIGKNRIRAVVVAVAAGLLGTGLGVSMMDGLLLRRRGLSDDDPMAELENESAPAVAPQAVPAPAAALVPAASLAQTPAPAAAAPPRLRRPATVRTNTRPPANDDGWSWGSGSEDDAAGVSTPAESVRS